MYSSVWRINFVHSTFSLIPTELDLNRYDLFYYFMLIYEIYVARCPLIVTVGLGSLHRKLCLLRIVFLLLEFKFRHWFLHRLPSICPQMIPQLPSFIWIIFLGASDFQFHKNLLSWFSMFTACFLVCFFWTLLFVFQLSYGSINFYSAWETYVGFFLTKIFRWNSFFDNIAEVFHSRRFSVRNSYRSNIAFCYEVWFVLELPICLYQIVFQSRPRLCKAKNRIWELDYSRLIILEHWLMRNYPGDFQNEENKWENAEVWDRSITKERKEGVR